MLDVYGTCARDANASFTTSVSTASLVINQKSSGNAVCALEVAPENTDDSIFASTHFCVHVAPVYDMLELLRFCVDRRLAKVALLLLPN